MIVFNLMSVIFPNGVNEVLKKIYRNLILALSSCFHNVFKKIDLDLTCYFC